MYLEERLSRISSELHKVKRMVTKQESALHSNWEELQYLRGLLIYLLLKLDPDTNHGYFDRYEVEFEEDKPQMRFTVTGQD